MSLIRDSFLLWFQMRKHKPIYLSNANNILMTESLACDVARIWTTWLGRSYLNVWSEFSIWQHTMLSYGFLVKYLPNFVEVSSCCIQQEMQFKLMNIVFTLQMVRRGNSGWPLQFLWLPSWFLFQSPHSGICVAEGNIKVWV